MLNNGLKSSYQYTKQSMLHPIYNALVAHVPEFLRIHRTIAPFTQQGLEKLNDQMTRFYFGSSNHRGTDALTQVLQKKNRLEHLHDEGYERDVDICVVFVANLVITGKPA